MSKATLLLGGILSYLLGLYLSPRLLPETYLSSLIVPLVAPQSSPLNNNHDNDNDKPIELPPLPPSLSPGNGATIKKRQTTVTKDPPAEDTINKEEVTYDARKTYNSLLGINDDTDPFQDVSFVIHRNGEADPCSTQRLDVNPSDIFVNASTAFSTPMNQYTKYDFDSMLTYALAIGTSPTPTQIKQRFLPKNGLLHDSGSDCSPTWKDSDHYLDTHTTTFDDQESTQTSEGRRKLLISPFVKYCDMGLQRTPVQLDHGRLVRLPHVKSLPCHYHTREGLRITSLSMLKELVAKSRENQECAAHDQEEGTCTSSSSSKKEIHLYAVPAGRVFVFAPKYVGEIFDLGHVSTHDDLPVSLEVLSLSPRVFDIYNFFSRDESSHIVNKALRETSESHRMKRSSTGASGYNVNSQRTSENGFDTHGKEAQAVKHRCMDVLGFDVYEESLTDGLQVLRYNKTTAYIPHLDWIDDYQKREEHDFDSGGRGSNRFATILLYMTDLEEGDGGETVFSEGWPSELAEEERVPFDKALAQLRESGDVEGVLKEGSWEESMVARCRSRLAVRPHSSRAVLFYSQNPDGSPDHNSLHGGCPVISGEKWAANLWVWNAPRGGFPGAPTNKEVVERNRAANKKSQDDNQKKASFSNSQNNSRMKDAKLYFQETFWGDLGFGATLNVNTYEGHEWNVKVGEEIVRKIVITKDKTQSYSI